MTMKLYIFDSCPFCVRVKTLIGLKQLECQITPLILGQIPVSLEGKLAQFSVPILEFKVSEHDERAGIDGYDLMVESLDIIRFLDQKEKPLFTSYEISNALQQLLNQLYSVSSPLLYPRMLALNLPELSTSSAIDLFVKSREKALGQSIEQASEKTQDYLPKLQKYLEELESLVSFDALVSGQRDLTLDDIVVFAEIRNYTMIAELNMSKSMLDFIHLIASRARISLYPQISQ